VEIMDLVL